jgi:hypothetical protein
MTEPRISYRKAPRTPSAQVSTVKPAAANRRKQYTNLGIVVTPIDVHTATSVAMNQSGYRAGTGMEIYTDVSAGAGAKYVVLKVNVFNDAKISLDLTCGYPIANFLLDDRDRQFGAIEKLYLIEGNPECNYQVQPGFDSDMTWVYRVPVSTRVVGWSFEDLTDFARSRTQPTIIPLEVPDS